MTAHLFYLLAAKLIKNPPLAVEFATLTLDKVTKQPKAKIYRPAEVDALLEKHGIAKKSDDDEMK